MNVTRVLEVSGSRPFVSQELFDWQTDHLAHFVSKHGGAGLVYHAHHIVCVRRDNAIGSTVDKPAKVALRVLLRNMLLDRQFTDRDGDLGHQIGDIQKSFAAHHGDLGKFAQITIDVFDADLLGPLNCHFRVDRLLQNLTAKDGSKVMPVYDHRGGAVAQTAVQAWIAERFP